MDRLQRGKCPSRLDGARAVRCSIGIGVTLQELTTLGTIVQIGLPPRRIDVITSLTRLTFDGAWATRVIHEADGLALPFLGRAALIDNKRAVARPKDLADVDALQRTVPNRTAAPLENLP